MIFVVWFPAILIGEVIPSSTNLICRNFLPFPTCTVGQLFLTFPPRTGRFLEQTDEGGKKKDPALLLLTAP